jgi:tRNA-dihydrouridine synthase B
MAGLQPLPPTAVPSTVPTALAPMQDVTDLPFMRLLGQMGAPDYFFTEYFRVHEHSTPEKHILASILHHGTGRPVFAQLIGEDPVHLRRTVKRLLEYPIAGIDLNMGCPAPKVYRKNVGGGLLRDPQDMERVIGTLRDACPGHFSVKSRIGFADTQHFEHLLSLIRDYQVDAFSLHGRTVRQMYRGEVDYIRIRQAAQALPCPVFANGNLTSARRACEVIEESGAWGAMIGRSAIRNPWIFRQVRDRSLGQPVFQPTLADVRSYIDDLWSIHAQPDLPDRNRLNRMKKFLNFVGQSVDPEGGFLHAMRRAREVEAFFTICDEWLIDNDRAVHPFPAEPYEGVIARPNHEAGTAGESCNLFSATRTKEG